MRALFEITKIAKADGDLIALSLRNKAVPDKPRIQSLTKGTVSDVLGFNPDELAQAIVVSQQKAMGLPIQDGKESTLILTLEQFERMKKPTVGATLQLDIISINHTNRGDAV